MTELQPSEQLVSLMLRPETVPSSVLGRDAIVAQMEEKLYKGRSPLEALKLATQRPSELLAMEHKFNQIGGAFKVKRVVGGNVTYEDPVAATSLFARKNEAETYGSFLTRVVVGGKTQFDSEPVLKTRVLDAVVADIGSLPFYSEVLDGLTADAKRKVFEKFFASKGFLEKLQLRLSAVPSDTIQKLDVQVLTKETELTAAQARLGALAVGDPTRGAVETEVINLGSALEAKRAERDALPEKVRSMIASAPKDAMLGLIYENIDTFGVQATTASAEALTAIEERVQSDMNALPKIWRRTQLNAESGINEHVVNGTIMKKLMKAYTKRGSAGLFEAILDRSSVDLQKLHDFSIAHPDQYQQLVVQTGARFMADYLRPSAGQHVGTDVVKGYEGKLKKRAIKKILNSSDPLKAQILYMAINNVRNPQTAMLAHELGMDDMVDYMKTSKLANLKMPEKFKKLFTTRKGLLLLASALGLAGGVWYWWNPIVHALSAAGGAIATGYGTASTVATTAVGNADKFLFSTTVSVPEAGSFVIQPGFIDNSLNAGHNFVFGGGGMTGLVPQAEQILQNIQNARP